MVFLAYPHKTRIFAFICPHLLYFYPAYYPHNTRILAKYDPRQIVATLYLVLTLLHLISISSVNYIT